MQQNVEVWQNILAVHSLVIPPREELDMWLKFIGLCRKVITLKANYQFSLLIHKTGRKVSTFT